MKEGSRKYLEGVLLKGKKRRKEEEEKEEEEEKKKDFQDKSPNHPESIFIKMALRSQHKPSLAEHSRARDSHFLSPSHSSAAVRESQVSQDPLGCLWHAIITCVPWAREEGHFPARQGGAPGKCGL